MSARKKRSTRTSATKQHNMLKAGHSGIQALEELDQRLQQDPAHSGTSLCRDLMRNISDQVVSVVLFGKYSSGKSTLLGSMVDRTDLLPRSNGPTTAVVTRVQQGPRAEATLKFSPMRVLGPLDECSEIEQCKALQSILDLWSHAEKPVVAVVLADASYKVLGAISQNDLLTRLDALRRKLKGKRKRLAPWHHIIIHLRRREPLSIPLRKKNRERLERWVAAPDLPLWLDEVVVTHPSKRLQGLVFVDTPGIDSLNISHRAATLRRVRGGQAVLFLAETRNAELHPDDRLAYRELFRSLEGTPEKLFHVCTCTDILLDNYLDDHPDLGEEAALKEIRGLVAGGLRAALEEDASGTWGRGGASRYRPGGRVDPRSIYLCNARDLGAHFLDGEQLEGDLHRYLESTETGHILRFNGKELAIQFENREAVVRSQLGTPSARDTSQYEEMARKKAQAQDLLDHLKDKVDDASREARKQIGTACNGVRKWLERGFYSKRNAAELGTRWDEQVEGLLTALDQRLERRLKGVEDQINEILGTTDTSYRLRQMDPSETHLDVGAIRSHMSGIGWIFKGIFDFFGGSSQKSNIDRARKEARNQIDHLEGKLCALSDERIRKTFEQTSKQVKVVRDAMRGMEKKLDDLKGDRDALRELNEALARIADTLRKSRTAILYAA